MPTTIDPAAAALAEALARRLTNAALSDRLEMLAKDVRAFDRESREAFLKEAANRLDNIDQAVVDIINMLHSLRVPSTK